MTDFGCIQLATGFCVAGYLLGSALVEGMRAFKVPFSVTP